MAARGRGGLCCCLVLVVRLTLEPEGAVEGGFDDT
jgi:hypothetical protein